MKKQLAYITLFLLCINANAQVYKSFNNTPLEKIYVHKNATLLFVGEYLYYKVYCLEAKTNKPSELSKIAYVELVGKNNNVIFKQKVALENGLGYGDFFIPTTVVSGNYKLVAYTQWMQNNSAFQFFETELNILNPYLGNQGAIVKMDNKVLAIKTEPTIDAIKTEKTRYLNRRFQLETNKNSYKKREKVSMQFINKNEAYGYGDFSVSVRKIDAINNLANYSAIDYKSDNFNKKIINTSFKKIIIPESNGELITGKVIESISGKAVANTKVTLSIPGESFLLKIVETNKNGEFHVYLNNEFTGGIAYIQILESNRNNFEIQLEKPISLDYSKLTFSSFKISPAQRKFIQQRSINNQIENSYFSVKPDSLLSRSKKEKFYNTEEAKVYVLEDYKLFPTINEVFIEVIDPIYKKRIDGEIQFFVKHRNDYVDDGSIPLVLLDGVIVQDYRSLLQYEAKKIDRVIVTSEKIFIGSIPYAGVIAIETKDKNFNWNFKDNQLTEKKLQKVNPQKKYFHQNYSDSLKVKNARIPDYRNQLLWEPHLVLNSNVSEFSFYTSDLEGKYEIILEGFSNIGEAVSLRKIIEVH